MKDVLSIAVVTVVVVGTLWIWFAGTVITIR